MTTLTRRRRGPLSTPNTDADGTGAEYDEPERTTSRRRTSRSRDEDEPEANEPTRRASRRSRGDDEEDKRPVRRGSSKRSFDKGAQEGSRRDSKRPARKRGKATGGFSAYSQKRRATSTYADEFKPDSGEETLIKILDEGPFDVYLQHWINEMPKGERKSYVCLNDEYFEEDDGCPLDDIGDKASTMSLFNVLDLSNPRKPEVKVWRTSVTVTDILDRLAESEKTSPLNRDDLYFEVTKTSKGNKTSWSIVPVKARDLQEDYDIEPFTEEELDEFEEDKFEDRTSVTVIDSYEDLLDIAEGL